MEQYNRITHSYVRHGGRVQRLHLDPVPRTKRGHLQISDQHQFLFVWYVPYYTVTYRCSTRQVGVRDLHVFPGPPFSLLDFTYLITYKNKTNNSNNSNIASQKIMFIN